MIARFPLTWPELYPRTARRRDAALRVDFATARDELEASLRLLQVTEPVISANIPPLRNGRLGSPGDREPDDPGVAVYFSRIRFVRAGASTKTETKRFVIACDTYRRVRWNVRAIGATVDALRAIERHGTSALLERALSGFAALPSASSPPPAPIKFPWWTVLDVDRHASIDQITAAFRERVKAVHPDVGGDVVAFRAVTEAFKQAKAERGAS